MAGQDHAAGAHIVRRGILRADGLHPGGHDAHRDQTDDKACHHGQQNGFPVILRGLLGHAHIFGAFPFFTGSARGKGFRRQLREFQKRGVVFPVAQKRQQLLADGFRVPIGDPVVAGTVGQNVPLAFLQAHQQQDTVIGIAHHVVVSAGKFSGGQAAEAVGGHQGRGKAVIGGTGAVNFFQTLHIRIGEQAGIVQNKISKGADRNR